MKAIVASPSRTLDQTLWRMPYDEKLLRGAQESCERDSTNGVELHPILQYLDTATFNRQTFEELCLPCFGARQLRSLLSVSSVCRDNATWPPVMRVQLMSDVPHICFDDCEPSSHVNNVRLVSPVSVEDFVRCFLESITKGVCYKYMHKASLFACMEWHEQKIDWRAAALTLSKPTWGDG